MNMILSKDEFVDVINDVEKSIGYQNGLNSYFRKNEVDGYILQPDCVATVLRLLHIIFDKSDKDNLIERFCLELEFGRKWKSGVITNKDGISIELKSTEDLYDYLLKCA